MLVVGHGVAGSVYNRFTGEAVGPPRRIGLSPLMASHIPAYSYGNTVEEVSAHPRYGQNKPTGQHYPHMLQAPCVSSACASHAPYVTYYLCHCIAPAFLFLLLAREDDCRLDMENKLIAQPCLLSFLRLKRSVNAFLRQDTQQTPSKGQVQPCQRVGAPTP